MSVAGLLFGVGLLRSRPRGCDALRYVHTGPVGSTPIPSIGRCLSCGSVFGYGD